MASNKEVVERSHFTDWKSARDILRKLREGRKRDSKTVVELGKVLVQSYSRKLGSEVWAIHEQMIPAALDVGDVSRAEVSLKSLQKQFPGSKRIKRLQGMLMEAKEDYDGAHLLYGGILEDDPTNLAIAKRKVAICKAQGDIAGAIRELTKILEMYMADIESWSELADLYISQHSYEKALFCLEELILSNPYNYLYHQKYAEVSYTIGTVDNLDVARKHYAAAINLNPKSLRSMYGLHQTSLALNRSKSRKVKNEDIIHWSSSKIREIYQESNGGKTAITVDLFLNSTNTGK